MRPSRHVATKRLNAATPITTLAWTELWDSTGQDVAGLQIYNGTTKLLSLGIGAAGAEVAWVDAPPGIGPVLPALISKTTRIAVKAVDADTTVGYLSVNFFA